MPTESTAAKVAPASSPAVRRASRPPL